MMLHEAEHEVSGIKTLMVYCRTKMYTMDVLWDPLVIEKTLADHPLLLLRLLPLSWCIIQAGVWKLEKLCGLCDCDDSELKAARCISGEFDDRIKHLILLILIFFNKTVGFFFFTSVLLMRLQVTAVIVLISWFLMTKYEYIEMVLYQRKQSEWLTV